MRRIVTVAIAALLLIVLGSTAYAADPGKGTIKGTLTNKTANGSSVADQEITLGTYKGSDDAGKKTTKSDKDGKFVFDGLETGADYTYQVTVTFQSAPYYSDPVNFSGATMGQTTPATPTAPTTEQSVQVQVWDSTTDSSVLKSSAHHYLLEGDKTTGAVVTEIIIINNNSDKSYIGKESHSGTNSTLKFTLPTGAQDFEPIDGLYPNRVLQVDGGFVDTMPVYPGMSQRVWRFSVPPTGDSSSFTAKLDMAADKVSVLVPDEGATVTVSNLSGPANQDIQGSKYLLFSGQNVAANTEFQFKMDNLSKIQPQQPQAGQPSAAAPGAPAAPAGSSAVPTAVIGGGVLAILVVFAVTGFVVTRRRREERQRTLALLQSEDAMGDEPSDDLESERRSLIASIARLDDLFEQDKISSEEYGRLRTEKKKRLIAVSKALKSPVGAGSRK